MDKISVSVIEKFFLFQNPTQIKTFIFKNFFLPLSYIKTYNVKTFLFLLFFNPCYKQKYMS